jgi:hypothetical protein
VGCFLTPSSPRGSTVIRAVDVATVAAVTDVEDGAADPASLADDVNNWTVADRRATSIFRLCCVWMTQTTARGPVDAGPLPFLPSSSPTEPPTARFRPGPSIRFGFQPPSTGLTPRRHTSLRDPLRGSLREVSRKLTFSAVSGSASF